MQININLATHPYEDAREFWVRWGSAVAVVAVLSIALIYGVVSSWMHSRDVGRKISQVQQEMAKVDADKAKNEAILNRAENKQTRDQSRFLNALIARKSFSWTQAFTEMEKIMPPHLHMVSVKPDLTESNDLKVTVTVAGDTRESALELVRHMEDSKSWRGPEVSSESNNIQGPGGDAVTFVITAMYVPTVGAPDQEKKASSDEKKPAADESAKPAGDQKPAAKPPVKKPEPKKAAPTRILSQMRAEGGMR